MRTIHAPLIDQPSKLDQQGKRIALNTMNWKEFAYLPQVECLLAHTGESICIKFLVNEKHLRGLELQDNGSVHKDSCVEFFLSLDDNHNYYNFEFNCIGTPHVGYGPGRENRQKISSERLRQIKITSSLPHEIIDCKGATQAWELTAEIPLSFFEEQPLHTLSRTTAACNIYKCGDETETPHFLSWHPIKTPNPDFHRPDFFGTIVFE